MNEGEIQASAVWLRASGADRARRTTLRPTAIARRGSVLALVAIVTAAGGQTTSRPASVLTAFAPQDVTITGGPALAAFDTNLRYLRSLDPDRLLWTFRKNAGLPTPGTPYGGWEAPDCELRGHFVGHYLSACARVMASTADPEIARNARRVVAGLAECQRALGGGYLSAFPSEFLDRVERRQAVWAPYYTIHKILAGLVDMRRLVGDEEALRVAAGLAAGIAARSVHLDDDAFQAMLGNEFGGMHEALLDLFEFTHQPGHRILAERFQKRAFLDPLARGEDPLAGLHANTHLPQILGQCRAYELFGTPACGDLIQHFWATLALRHSYVTGGSNEGESWGPADKLANTLSDANQEFCTSWNWRRINRSLLLATGDVKYADMLERVLFNGLFVSQHPESGQFIYFLGLRAGSTKVHGTPTETFTCCYGTGLEACTAWAEDVFAHEGDAALRVVLPIDARVSWRRAGGVVQIAQATDPVDVGHVVISVTPPARDTNFVLMLRRPAWAKTGGAIRVGADPLAVETKAGSWIRIDRAWNPGDVVDVRWDAPLSVVPINDDPNLCAVMAGPLVLAGVLDDGDLPFADVPPPPLTGDKLTPKHWLKPMEGSPRRWRTRNQPKDLTFIPLMDVVEQRYGVYWRFGVMGGSNQKAYETALATARDREARTIDRVLIGDEASEAAHVFVGRNSRTGRHEGARWRDAGPGGDFRFRLSVSPDAPNSLAVSYWGSDGGARVFDIEVEERRIATEKLANSAPGRFFTVEYPIPPGLTQGKTHVTVRFAPAPNGEIAGGVFGLASLRRK